MHSKVSGNTGWLVGLGISKHFGAVSALVFSLVLSACGGGSGGDGNTLTAVDGAPSLTSASISADDNATVTVGDVVTVTVTASEAIMAPSVTIGGSAATSVLGSGEDWTASRAMTADDTVGDISFSVSFSDISGESGESVSTSTDSSAVAFEINTQAGNAIDGPFQFAKAFGDYNGNGVHDENEPSSITDADGAYSLIEDTNAPETYTIIVEIEEAIDSVTGESFAGTGVVLRGSSAGAVVTPLTTLLDAAKAADPSYTAEDLADALGLPEGVHVEQYNPFAADADPATAHAVETVFQQVMTATLIVSEAMMGLGDMAGVELTAEQASAAALQAITSMVVSSTVTVDLSDSTQADSLAAFAVQEMADSGIVVSDAVSNLVLGQAIGSVAKISGAFAELSADDFGTTAASAVSLLKHDATEELESMSAAAITFLADPANDDLGSFDASVFVTLNTDSGINSAIADHEGDLGDGAVGGVLDFEDTAQAIYFADIGIAGDDAFPGSNSSAVMDVDDNTNTVIQSVRLASGKAWNSVLFVIGSDIDSPDDTFPFAANDSVMSMDIRPGSVGKTVALKFEGPDGAAVITKATTTTSVADQWETLYFDFDAPIEGTSVSVGVEYFKVLVFYDFGGSPTADETFYFDNITYGGVVLPNDGGDTGGGDTGGGDTDSGDTRAPDPTLAADQVISLFGDSYTPVNVTNNNPAWGQATQVTVTDVLTYTNLNYQGYEFEAQDVSSKEFFHVDFYTEDSTALNMFVIKAGGGETAYSLTDKIVAGQWVSVDIPLSAYGNVDLTAVNQLKVDGNGTVVFDNLYFHGSAGGDTDSSGGNNDSSAEGELVTNGDFETGDFSGWEVDDGGTKAVVNTDQNGGTYSASLSSTNGGGDAVIKAANLASGSLTTGQTATISFDLKGSMTGAGGVVFAQFFHEKAEGGTSNGEGILSGAPLALSSSWQSHSYTSVISGEVAGGVSLLLKAGCGGDACTVDAYFDNVSVTVK